LATRRLREGKDGRTDLDGATIGVRPKNRFGPPIVWMGDIIRAAALAASWREKGLDIDPPAARLGRDVLARPEA
jgi:hypothetical protein